MSDKRMAAVANRVHEILAQRALRLERQSVDALAYSFILDGAPVDDMTEDQARAKLRTIMAENGLVE